VSWCPQIFKKAGLALFVRPYHVLATNRDAGLIEVLALDFRLMVGLGVGLWRVWAWVYGLGFKL